MKDATAHGTLLVFARNPVAGQVKTRLAGGIGPARAADVYRRMLEHTLRVAERTAGAETAVWIADGEPDATLQSLLDLHGLPWHRQRGNDLGMRMHHALDVTLRTGARAVLIGSDCPEFTPDYVGAAFAALENADVVLGPAADGGYVLIGARRADPTLFSDIRWGDADVLAVTRRRLTDLGLMWRELPVLHDVDTPEDLARFPWLAAPDT